MKLCPLRRPSESWCAVEGREDGRVEGGLDVPLLDPVTLSQEPSVDSALCMAAADSARRRAVLKPFKKDEADCRFLAS